MKDVSTWAQVDSEEAWNSFGQNVEDNLFKIEYDVSK